MRINIFCTPVKICSIHRLYFYHYCIRQTKTSVFIFVEFRLRSKIVAQPYSNRAPDARVIRGTQRACIKNASFFSRPLPPLLALSPVLLSSFFLFTNYSSTHRYTRRAYTTFYAEHPAAVLCNFSCLTIATGQGKVAITLRFSQMSS